MLRVRFLPFLVVVAASPALAQAGPQLRIVNDDNVVLDGVPEVPARIIDLLNQYQNVRSAFFSDWIEDGNGMYIVTRFGDVRQLHRVEMPGGARAQITFFREPVSGAARRPGGPELLFGMDEGGSEFFQFFLLDPKTGEYGRLTDGTSRNGAAEWSGDGSRIAYQSTRRNGRSNDVWVMDVADTSSARVVFEAPDGSWYGPTDWDETGEKLLVLQYVSITDSRIHLIDVRSGERTLLAGGGEDPANFAGIAPVFTPDGKGVFVATDAGSDFSRLTYLDVGTRGLETITDEIEWDVESFELSEDGSRAAFTVNEGGLERLYLMDPRTWEYAPVMILPSGLIGGLKFSPEASRLAMTLVTADSPGDVYTLELGPGYAAARDLVRWTSSEIGGLDSERFVTPELVRFPTFDSNSGGPKEIPAWVYRPRGGGPHPVVVSIHGGPEGQYRPGFSRTYQMWVNELGAAVIAPNVRGSAGYGKEYVKLDNGFLRENSVKDIGALLDWIASQPDLDETRVAVFGGSYGGYMVLASLVQYGDRLRAGVDIVGISNFVTFLENTQSYRRDLRRVEYGDERDPEMRAFLDRISPNRNADRIRVPLFVAQGQNDPRVPVTESEQMVAAVRANGQDVWYMNALNEGHGFRKKENFDLFEQITFMFFEEHLMERERLPRTD
ncbi:MAG: S9 family peptidase [Gemmatimonadota bacterium]